MTGTVINIPLSELHFDPLNPRLPSDLQGKGDEEVLEFLLLQCNLVELMQSIGEKDYFAGEPLLVVPRPTGGFWVVEGNRRLGALKLLQPNAIAPVKPREVEQARKDALHRPTNIPTLKFKSRDEILGYLGYRHITGVKEWEPLAKARYLMQLRKLYGADHEEAHKALARTIGSKASNVAKLLTGLSLLEVARDEGILMAIHRKEDDIEFSLLTTGIGYQGIQKFIGLNGVADVELKTLKQDEFAEFFRWVFERRDGMGTYVGESRRLGQLDKVVANARALSAARRGEPLETAFLYTSGPLEALRQFMIEAEKNLRAAQESTLHAEGVTDADVDHATRLQRAGANLRNSIANLVENESEAGDADA